MKRESKANVVNKFAKSEDLCDITKNLLLILAYNDDMKELTSICEQFDVLNRKVNKEVLVSVTSAFVILYIFCNNRLSG